MERARVWLAVSPIIAAGVLVAHALAYRLTGTPTGTLHAYLDHGPQLLLLLGVVVLGAAGLGARLRVPPAWPFPFVALAAFVGQEHLERIVHTGEPAWLVTSPAFVVGLLLQAPVALVAWVLARRLLRAFETPPSRRARLPYVLTRLAAPVTAEARPAPAGPLPARGPPLLHRR